MFYSWECVSFVRKIGSTFDLVIRNREHLMALLHFMHRNMYKKCDPEAKLFRSYKWLSLKMKMSYECWLRNIKLSGLIEGAIY